jgi:hypothetical protein
MTTRATNDDVATEISTKLNVLIALSLRQPTGEKSFERAGKRRTGISGIVRYLADMGLTAKDIAEIVGSPVTSVRTLPTPARRK